MAAPATAMCRKPYGLSFAVDDLIHLRSWAEARGLCMVVSLDQVIDNAEFEEMVILAPSHRRQRTLTVWRTLSGVFLQTPNGKLRGFSSVEEGLCALRPAVAQRRSWLSYLKLRVRAT